MILLVHMLFGAAIGASVTNIPLAIILAFLGHYVLDVFPHIEYSVSHIKSNQWSQARPDMLKVILDFCLGIFLVSLFSKNHPMAYAGALLGILPDGLTIVSSLAPNRFFALHDLWHTGKLHFLRYKKISNFWRIVSQGTAAVLSIMALLMQDFKSL